MKRTYKDSVIKKFEELSQKYHKMSLLFYELSRSLNIELKPIETNPRKIKEYLKKHLNIDLNKVMELTKTDIFLKDLKKRT